MSPISEADLDRLADYSAGLLDPQERARVDELIATDPEWRQAHADLTAAQPHLDLALAGLGAAPLPADVAARLDATLARELDTSRAHNASHELDTSRELDATRPGDASPAREVEVTRAREPDATSARAAGRAAPGTATVVDLSSRRRWRRMAAGTLAAAAAALAIFGGVVTLSNSGATRSSSPNTGAGLAAPPGGSSENFAGGGPSLRYSGTDYTPQNLSGVLSGDQAKDSASGSGARPNAPGPAAVAGPTSDADLARLTDSTALHGCLDAIVARHGGTPSVVDYARFQGRPALIVVLVGDGTRRIVVAGPDCGIAGPDELYSTIR